MAVLGIDFGTANSAAAAIIAGSKQHIMIEPVEQARLSGGIIYPSYVQFDHNGGVISVGNAARDRFYYQGQNALIVRHFKRLIGRPYSEVTERIALGHRAFQEFDGRLRRDAGGLIKVAVGDVEIPVTDIAAHLIKAIVADAKAQLHGEEITSAVICLPAGFADEQRRETTEAARKAGLSDVQIHILEEPTAAAISKGVAGLKGNIMVVDVGAGTTDVIIGHMVQEGDGLRLIATNRECDDLLGGIDMDGLILDYLKNDALRGIYEDLEDDGRLALWGKIEEAKINASLNGQSNISRRLPLKNKPSTVVDFTLTREKLNEIIMPVIWGYKTPDGYQKGIKPVVERALLKAAGGSLKAVPEVIQSIKSIILVGGPCRMGALHEMLTYIFKANEELVRQIKAVDPLDPFFMEGVAAGAAASQGVKTSVMTSMSSTVSIYHHSTGIMTVIPEGTPYTREAGLKRTLEVNVCDGTIAIYTLHQSDASSPRVWPVSQHLVNVPQEGMLQITLAWEEGGLKQSRLDGCTVSGCGLPGPIQLSQDGSESFGGMISQGMRQRFNNIKSIESTSQICYRCMKAELEHSLSPAEANMTALRQVCPSDECVERCQDLDVDKESELTETELLMIAKEGFYKASDKIIKARGEAYAEANEIVKRILEFWAKTFIPSTVFELMVHARSILGMSKDDSSVYYQQLTRWLSFLETNPKDASYAAATATSLAAYAQHLFHNGNLMADYYEDIAEVCRRFKSALE